eukprot:GHVU01077980.1.p1 GENE.GHVU01077980.1~~GHVU01077980.1.p1  ORF type:complete len:110 (+),score=3.06 GHVU01077980.1:1049-1378(+)
MEVRRFDASDSRASRGSAAMSNSSSTLFDKSTLSTNVVDLVIREVQEAQFHIILYRLWNVLDALPLAIESDKCKASAICQRSLKDKKPCYWEHRRHSQVTSDKPAVNFT